MDLKRVLRYLKGYPECSLVYGWQGKSDVINIFVGSDWAGDTKTRRFTSSGVIMLGNQLIYHWSKMQLNIALSSAEAELNSLVKGVCEAMGIKMIVRFQAQERFRSPYRCLSL